MSYTHALTNLVPGTRYYEAGMNFLKREGEENAKKAVKCFERAADSDYTDPPHPGACLELGKCCHNGQGVDQDYKKAVEWFQKAADKGLADAQYRLGICLVNGNGIQKDVKEGCVQYEKAANQGHSEAMCALARWLLYGKEGVESDEKKGREWLKRSFDVGCPAAIKLTNELNEKLAQLKASSQTAAGAGAVSQQPSVLPTARR